MSVSYFVLYRGQADDPAAFVGRYRDTHVPILQTWPGIRGVAMHTPQAWTDPEGVRHADLALIAEMTFDNAADLQRALASPGRAEARRDFQQFPAFHGEVLHQAVRTERWR